MSSVVEDPSFVADMIKVSSYEDVAAALKAPGLQIIREEYVGEFLAGTLSAINGDEHLVRRRMEAALVSSSALVRYEEQTLLPLLDEFFEECRNDRDPDGFHRCDLVEVGLYLLVRLGASIGGLDGVSSRDDALRLTHYVDAWGIGTGFEWIRLPPAEREALFAETVEIGKSYEADFFRPSLERRAALVEAHRAGAITADELPQDVLTLLLLNREDGWDDRLLFREVALFLNASIKTTTRGLCHSVDEIWRWIADHPEDSAIVEDSTQLRGAVSEVLRIHPLLPAMVRRAAVDTTMPSGLVVPCGASVGVLFARANRDRSVFGDDADEFDPFRCRRLPASVSPYGLSFGGGRHVCLGRRMAMGDSLGSAEAVAEGTFNALVERFFAAGVEPDPNRAAVRNEASYYDEYLEYPVRLTSL